MKTDASREAFEVWWKSILRLPHEDKHSAFMGWQASRKQALADAADFLVGLRNEPDMQFLATKIKELK